VHCSFPFFFLTSFPSPFPSRSLWEGASCDWFLEAKREPLCLFFSLLSGPGRCPTGAVQVPAYPLRYTVFYLFLSPPRTVFFSTPSLPSKTGTETPIYHFPLFFFPPFPAFLLVSPYSRDSQMEQVLIASPPYIDVSLSIEFDSPSSPLFPLRHPFPNQLTMRTFPFFLAWWVRTNNVKCPRSFFFPPVSRTYFTSFPLSPRRHLHMPLFPFAACLCKIWETPSVLLFSPDLFPSLRIPPFWSSRSSCNRLQSLSPLGRRGEEKRKTETMFSLSFLPLFFLSPSLFPLLLSSVRPPHVGNKLIKLSLKHVSFPCVCVNHLYGKNRSCCVERSPPLRFSRPWLLTYPCLRKGGKSHCYVSPSQEMRKHSLCFSGAPFVSSPCLQLRTVSQKLADSIFSPPFHRGLKTEVYMTPFPNILFFFFPFTCVRVLEGCCSKIGELFFKTF